MFDAKTDRGSSDMYFKYYGMLQHQQNMLQVREVVGGVGCCCAAAGSQVSMQKASKLMTDHLWPQSVPDCFAPTTQQPPSVTL